MIIAKLEIENNNSKYYANDISFIVQPNDRISSSAYIEELKENTTLITTITCYAMNHKDLLAIMYVAIKKHNIDITNIEPIFHVNS